MYHLHPQLYIKHIFWYFITLFVGIVLIICTKPNVNNRKTTNYSLVINKFEELNLKIPNSLFAQGLDFVWFSISGSLLFFIGGLMNVVKVFKMLQIDDLRPEKLRGDAEEKLIQGRERDGEIPFIFEEQRRRKRGKEQERFIL